MIQVIQIMAVSTKWCLTGIKTWHFKFKTQTIEAKDVYSSRQSLPGLSLTKLRI
jgi:hypothetical protein